MSLEKKSGVKERNIKSRIKERDIKRTIKRYELRYGIMKMEYHKRRYLGPSINGISTRETDAEV